MAQSTSDDDVITQERERIRRKGYLQYAGILLLALMTCWTYLPALEAWRIAATPYDYYVMAACIAALFVYAVVFVGCPSIAAGSHRLIPRQIDSYLLSARRQWLLLLVLLFGPIEGASRLMANIDEGVRVHRLARDFAITHSAALGPALIAFGLILSSLSFALPFTWFRRSYDQVLQDELVRELRAKAVKIGYIGAVLAMATGFVVLSVTTIDPLQWLIWSTYAVVALPILSYVVLEARAGRSD